MVYQNRAIYLSDLLQEDFLYNALRDILQRPLLKKIFELQAANKKPERVSDSIKNELRKYLKRERKKSLPEDAQFWEFECRFGQTSDTAERLNASELIKALDRAYDAAWERCYIEIISKPSSKNKTAPDTQE